MARPRMEQPTAAEFEVLKVLWEIKRPATVREVLEILNDRVEPPRAYTSVMSLLTVMAEKGSLKRSPQGRAFLYEPAYSREQTLKSFVGETLTRIYDGATGLMLTHLLDQSSPDDAELDEIGRLIDAYRRARQIGGKP